MSFIIEVENIKCGGCANSIRKNLLKNCAVKDVVVNVEAQTITIDTDLELLEVIKDQLHSMGYPERGTAHGFDAAKTKAKSFVSCAIGRMAD